MQSNQRMMNRVDRDKHVSTEEDATDRISTLPQNILDKIFKDMTFLELTRTCVLSNKWKYFWATHPTLILDREFFDEISDNIKIIEYGLSNIIDKILLNHVGSIEKFVLDLSIIYYHNWDLDHWLLYVTKKCVKELTLDNTNDNPYTLPICILNCSTLIYLNITNCIIKLPYSITLFSNILELYLKFIDFDPATKNNILHTPLLSTLTFTACNGIHYLNISAPRIELLTINDSHEIRASFFERFTNVEVLSMILFLEELVNYAQEEFITWSRLLFLCPNLKGLVLSNYCIGLLGREILPKRFPFKANHLENVKLSIEFDDIDQVSGVLSLIRSSPNLHTLEIHVYHGNGRSRDEVIRYLRDQSCVDQQFEKLEYVDLRGFEGTLSELIFLKLILTYSPSLLKMIVSPSNELDDDEVLNFCDQLMISLIASPRADIILGPYISVE